MLSQSHLITQLPQACRERTHPRQAHPLSWLPWLAEAEHDWSLVHQYHCRLLRHFRRMRLKMIERMLAYCRVFAKDIRRFQRYPSIFMPWPQDVPDAPGVVPEFQTCTSFGSFVTNSELDTTKHVAWKRRTHIYQSINQSIKSNPIPIQIQIQIKSNQIKIKIKSNQTINQPINQSIINKYQHASLIPELPSPQATNSLCCSCSRYKPVCPCLVYTVRVVVSVPQHHKCHKQGQIILNNMI